MPKDSNADKPKGKLHLLSAKMGAQTERTRNEGGFKPQTPPPPPAETLQEGDYLEWFDAAEVEDNPFQPRTIYPNSKQAELVASMNEDGQMEPAGVRILPDGTKQHIWGHRRNRAVRFGALVVDENGAVQRIYANAGSRQPHPERYVGKILCIVRANVTDLEMARQAGVENESHLPPGPIDRANHYANVRRLLTEKMHAEGTLKPGREVPLRTLGAFLNRSYQEVGRVLQYLELPQEIQDALQPPPKQSDPNAPEAIENEPPSTDEEPKITERHARALILLLPWPEHLRGLYRDIFKHGYSGAVAEIKAGERLALLREKVPNVASVVQQAEQLSLARAEAIALETKEEQAASENEAQERRAGIGLVGDSSSGGTSTRSVTLGVPTTTEGQPETAEATPTRTGLRSSIGAEYERLPELADMQMHSGRMSLDYGLRSFEAMEIAPQDWEEWNERVKALEALTKRYRKHLDTQKPKKDKEK